jgi:hypothetical protein
MLKLNSKTAIELTGMLGIIFSLVFVGMEISQNSAVAQAQQIQSISDSFSNIFLTSAQNPELAELIVGVNTGIISVELLDGAQFSSLYMFNLAMLVSLEATFSAVATGVLPREYVSQFDGSYVINPFVIANWESIKPILDVNFIEYVESRETFIRE